MVKNSSQLSASIEEMQKSAAVRKECTRVAENVLAFLKEAAPYDDSPDRNPLEPHYRDNLFIEQDTTDRAVVRVVAKVHAVGVEAEYGLLKKAIKAAR